MLAAGVGGHVRSLPKLTGRDRKLWGLGPQFFYYTAICGWGDTIRDRLIYCAFFCDLGFNVDSPFSVIPGSLYVMLA